MRREPFEAIVARYGPTVLRVCRAVLGPTTADDAWSETFLSAMRAYPDLRPDSNVEAWLVTIAHRKALDQLRAESRRAVPTDDLPEKPSRDGVPGGWESDLWAALKALPLKQRQSVAYHYLAACRTPTSPRSWAGAQRRRGERPPTASSRYERRT
jgi:RNA polymerase sigma factor (sigma-70 family)